MHITNTMIYEQQNFIPEVKFNTTQEVTAIGEMHFEGNIIPHYWYQNIKYQNGKVDLNSIIILAEIVYWYRPTYIRDEGSGLVTSVQKKFKSDSLQKDKKSLANQFGLTLVQVQDSLARLEKMGLIYRDYRTILVGDKRMSNVLFIKINPEKIREVTFGQVYCYKDQSPGLYTLKSRPLSTEVQTNTYINTENKTKKEIYAPPGGDASTSSLYKILGKRKQNRSASEGKSSFPGGDASNSDLSKKNLNITYIISDQESKNPPDCQEITLNKEKSDIERRYNVFIPEDFHQSLIKLHGEEKVEFIYNHFSTWKENKLLELSSPKEIKAFHKASDMGRLKKWAINAALKSRIEEAEIKQREERLNKNSNLLTGSKELTINILKQYLIPNDITIDILSKHVEFIRNGAMHSECVSYSDPRFKDQLNHLIQKYGCKKSLVM